MQNKEAMYYKSLPDEKVECLLCPVNCKLSDGKEGQCMGRKNLRGKMIATNYAQIVSLNVDPIEKKTSLPFLSW